VHRCTGIQVHGSTYMKHMYMYEQFVSMLLFFLIKVQFVSENLEIPPYNLSSDFYRTCNLAPVKPVQISQSPVTCVSSNIRWYTCSMCTSCSHVVHMYIHVCTCMCTHLLPPVYTSRKHTHLCTLSMGEPRTW